MGKDRILIVENRDDRHLLPVVGVTTKCRTPTWYSTHTDLEVFIIIV